MSEQTWADRLESIAPSPRGKNVEVTQANALDILCGTQSRALPATASSDALFPTGDFDSRVSAPPTDNFREMSQHWDVLASVRELQDVDPERARESAAPAVACLATRAMPSVRRPGSGARRPASTPPTLTG